MNKEELDQIHKLIREGNSLNEIANKLSRSKTTIYYHFRKIKGSTYSNINLNQLEDEAWGDFLGLFAGDGNYFKTKTYNYRIYIFFGPDQQYIHKEVKILLTNLFKKTPSEGRRVNVLYLYYCSKELIELMKEYLDWDQMRDKTYTVHLKKRAYSAAFKRGFLRGNIDSDGYISKNRIEFASVSPLLIQDISQFTKDMGFKFSYTLRVDSRPNRKDMHIVNILKSDHKLFLNVISPRKIGGANAPAGIRISEC
ncbi:MAG: helix-turn-helix domain-containing protein [Nanoarchaeota archaeon]|nr:helix-turn-helix domain-containing protein [Nanoarchaeota archaeon]